MQNYVRHSLSQSSASRSLLSFTIVAIVSYGNREYTPRVARSDTVGVDG